MSKESFEVVEEQNTIIERAKNPYADGAKMELASPIKAEGQLAVQGARELAEVQGMVFMAKQFPRNRMAAVERILNDCTRPTLAENALYSYARGGSEITGPSIRLAESMAQNWGNIDFGIRELEQKNGKSLVMAFAWDMETNARQTKVFEVPHIRATKKGSYKLEDPRDIYELIANNGARRLRACILGIIPGDVVEAAVAQCETTMKAKADTSAENVKKMVEAFEKLGVSKTAIEKRIQRRMDAILPAQMVQLKKIYKSLQDGVASVQDFFEADQPKSEGEETPKGGVKGLKSKIGD